MSRTCLLRLLLSAPLLGAGCSGSIKEFPVAETTGVVLCNGKPVAFAKVFFTPEVSGKSAEVGKPAFAYTGEDGRFTLSTYGSEDGAVVGKNAVRVMTDPQRPCECEGDEVRDLMLVEIKEDQPNEFELVLPRRTRPARPSPFDDPVEPATN